VADGSISDGVKHEQRSPRILGLQRSLAWKIARPVPTRKDACLFIQRAGPPPFPFLASLPASSRCRTVRFRDHVHWQQGRIFHSSFVFFFCPVSRSFLVRSSELVRETCHSLIIKSKPCILHEADGSSSEQIRRCNERDNRRTSTAMHAQFMSCSSTAVFHLRSHVRVLTRESITVDFTCVAICTSPTIRNHSFATKFSEPVLQCKHTLFRQKERMRRYIRKDCVSFVQFGVDTDGFISKLVVEIEFSCGS
jgi:hypothetical protein